jgi:3-hydroxyisobutyrate dehydrogenase
VTAPHGGAGRVGFVGLGRMGVPMSRRLLDAGYAVVGYDVSPAARAVVAALPGAEVTEKVTEVADGADVVVLMLPGSAVVEDVLIDADLLDALSSDTILVDMSSSEPSRTKALAARASVQGQTLIDAPVSGGVRGAETGALTIMVGAPDEVFAQVLPMLQAMGSRVVHAGSVGAGHAVKALNNLMSASHLLASSEAMLTGMAFGLDPAVILEVVNGSSGRSGSTQLKWPDYILTGTYGSGFSMQLMVKDMRIALDLARQTGIPARSAALAVELWSQALDALPPGADHTEIARWLEQASANQDLASHDAGTAST